MSRRWFLAALVLPMAVVAAFSPALSAQFLHFDDNLYVTENPLVRTGWSLSSFRESLDRIHLASGYWIPLTWWSHMTDCHLFGLNPGPHHAVNIAWHGLNTLLLAWALLRWTGEPGASLLAAALWGLHPARVESVAWIAERKDVVSGCFWMLAMGCYAGAQPTPMWKWGTIALLMILGVMAKPVVVVLPVALLLLDAWPGARTDPGTRRVLEKWPLWTIAFLASFLTILSQSRAGAVQDLDAFGLGYRFANAITAYVGYLVIWFVPVRLAPFYPPDAWYTEPLPVMASLALLAAISVACFRVRCTRPYGLVGWLWFLLLLVPTIGLVQSGQQRLADRFLYLPSIGLSMSLAWAVRDLWSGVSQARRWFLTAGVGACLLGLSVLTFVQTGRWADDRTLFEYTCAVTERNYLAHTNLGFARAQAGDVLAAQREYEAALAAEPRYALAWNNLGLLHTEAGRRQEALECALKACQYKPRHGRFRFHLGLALAATGQWREAIDAYETALRLQPDLVEAELNLGLAWLAVGAVTDAKGALERYVQARPNDPRGWINLGIAEKLSGSNAAAVRAFSAVLQQDPRNVAARANLAACLIEENRWSEGIEQQRAALALRPDSPELLNNLAWSLATVPERSLRRGTEAVGLAERAVASGGPGDANPVFLSTLAAAYAEVGQIEKARSVLDRAIDLARQRSDERLAQELMQRRRAFEPAPPP